MLCPYNADVLTLRPYKQSDFDQLLRIDQSCFVPGIAYEEAEMRHFLGLRNAVRIVAVDGTKVQGFIIAAPFRSRRGEDLLGQIITIDVEPKSQHLGIGHQLLTSAEEELKVAGCGYVSLQVAVDNQNAISFYKKHHYRVLKVLPRYYLQSLDALLMGKKL